MSKKQTSKQENSFHGAKMKKITRDIFRTLKRRGLLIERTLKDIEEVGRGLERERNEISDSIDKTIQEIRDALDLIVEDIHDKITEQHHVNLKILQENEINLMDKLKVCKEDMAKCDEILTDSIPNELKVNKAKVLEMVIGSVEKNKFTPPTMELNRFGLERDSKFSDVTLTVKKMIGNFLHRTETLGEIKHPFTPLKTIAITNSEVNAIQLTSSNGRTRPWVCSGVSNEIVNFTDYGVREKVISTDFEVNDFVVNDSRIYATSPDSHYVRCLKLTQNGGFVQIFSIKDDLHLQGITLCRHKKTFAVCGTDRPNYSSQPPNEVVIVEYTFDGKELKRLAISKFSGKVYRMSQNVNNNYVFTFPKEGKVLSVDNMNGEIRSSFDKIDFRLFVSNRLKVKKNADFWPTGICCDANGNIFVTEYLEKLLLMMDSDCTPLRLIGDIYTCPNAVCFYESTNCVWLGDKGKLHVWKIENTFKVD